MEKDELVNVNLWITKRDLARARKLAEYYGVTPNEVLQQSIEDGLGVEELNASYPKEQLIKPHSVGDQNWTRGELRVAPELKELQQN